MYQDIVEYRVIVGLVGTLVHPVTQELVEYLDIVDLKVYKAYLEILDIRVIVEHLDIVVLGVEILESPDSLVIVV